MSFVDTSCFFTLPGSYHVLPHWILTPKPLATICDRVFYAAAKNYGLRSTVVEEPTVFYECLWSSVYEAAALPVPSNAKPNIDIGQIFRWLDSLTEKESTLAHKRVGASIRGLLDEIGKPVSRNAQCPCGSGKKFKHCHGSPIQRTIA